MDFNLALILVLLTAVSGIFVAYNHFVYNKRLQQGGDPSKGLDVAIEYSRSFFPVLLIVLIIRSFIFEPFRIPSGSMMPTLVQGDFIFVKKFQYGLRLPVTETKIIETGSPQRGDVVVFRLPQNPSINYIKRVIGLPGDEIIYKDRQLSINGELVSVDASSRFEMRDQDLYMNGTLVMGDIDPQSPGTRFDAYSEVLGERRHDILLEQQRGSSRVGRYRVPEGHYFMMGDNRDNSKDSRFIDAIPETHLVGEAVLIWMHMDGLEWPNWGRIGTRIQ